MAEVSRVLVVAHVTTVGGNVRDEVANTCDMKLRTTS